MQTTASLAAVILLAVGAVGQDRAVEQDRIELHVQGVRADKLEATVGVLEATVVRQSAQLEQQQGQMNQQEVQLAELRELVLRVSQRGGEAGRDAPTTVATSVEAAGRTTPRIGRRMSGASGDGTAVGARAWQTHVFPSGHSCPNLDDGQVKQLLPVNNRSEVTWNPAPENLPADANVSLCSVANDWSTAEIQTFPAPFKIVHDATCTAPPALHLTLDTTVSGALTIATAGPTWTDMAAAMAVAMGFQASGMGVCSGTATFTQTALMHGEAAGSPTLDPPDLSILTWAKRAFQTCRYLCKYVSVNADGSYSAFASDQCASRTGTTTAMTFELALSGYVKHDNVACNGRNELLSASSGYTYEQCQAVCDADATCLSFEFTDFGACLASTSCVFEVSTDSPDYQLHVKMGK